MSVTEFIGQPKLEPGESIKEWNHRRRKEIADKRSANFHRTLVDQINGTTKVRAYAVMRGDRNG